MFSFENKLAMAQKSSHDGGHPECRENIENSRFRFERVRMDPTTHTLAETRHTKPRNTQNFQEYRPQQSPFF